MEAWPCTLASWRWLLIQGAILFQHCDQMTFRWIQAVQTLQQYHHLRRLRYYIGTPRQRPSVALSSLALNFSFSYPDLILALTAISCPLAWFSAWICLLVSNPLLGL